MGTGMRTYVPATAPYCVVGLILLMQPPLLTSLLMGTGFAAGRALTPLTRYMSDDGDRWDNVVEATHRTFVPILGVGVAIATVACSLMMIRI